MDGMSRTVVTASDYFVRLCHSEKTVKESLLFSTTEPCGDLRTGGMHKTSVPVASGTTVMPHVIPVGLVELLLTEADEELTAGLHRTDLHGTSFFLSPAKYVSDADESTLTNNSHHSSGKDSNSASMLRVDWECTSRVALSFEWGNIHQTTDFILTILLALPWYFCQSYIVKPTFVARLVICLASILALHANLR